MWLKWWSSLLKCDCPLCQYFDKTMQNQLMKAVMIIGWRRQNSVEVSRANERLERLSVFWRAAADLHWQQRQSDDSSAESVSKLSWRVSEEESSDARRFAWIVATAWMMGSAISLLTLACLHWQHRFVTFGLGAPGQLASQAKTKPCGWLQSYLRQEFSMWSLGFVPWWVCTQMCGLALHWFALILIIFKLAW